MSDKIEFEAKYSCNPPKGRYTKPDTMVLKHIIYDRIDRFRYFMNSFVYIMHKDIFEFIPLQESTRFWGRHHCLSVFTSTYNISQLEKVLPRLDLPNLSHIVLSETELYFLRKIYMRSFSSYRCYGDSIDINITKLIDEQLVVRYESGPLYITNIGAMVLEQRDPNFLGTLFDIFYGKCTLLPYPLMQRLFHILPIEQLPKYLTHDDALIRNLAAYGINGRTI